jgi:four helix bundle protein
MMAASEEGAAILLCMETGNGRRGHRELVVWQRAMELAMESYSLAKRLPAEERFALASQIRRAASSVPSNIAEGSGHLYKGAYVRHLSIARASLMELDTQLEIAIRAGYFDLTAASKSLALIDHVGRMLTRLAKAVAPANHSLRE